MFYVALFSFFFNEQRIEIINIYIYMKAFAEIFNNIIPHFNSLSILIS